MLIVVFLEERSYEKTSSSDNDCCSADDNSFYSHVERFINIGTFWMQVIRDLALAPEPEAKNETGSGDMEIFSEFMTV